MSIEAWVFLSATTNGTTNLMFFLSLLSKMVTKETSNTKRGVEYVVRPGEVDDSLLSLSADWHIGRKAVTRLLRDFANYGLITVAPSRLTSTISMTCVVCWIDGGRRTTNPCYTSKIGNYEGVRIFLYNGQELPNVRKNSKRRNTPKENRTKQEDAIENASNDDL